MKTFFLAIATLFTLISCSKESGNKGILNGNNIVDSVTTVTKNSNGFKSKTKSVTYKAEDGSRAKVTFETKDGKETLTIFANGKTITLDKNLSSANGDMYERNDIKAKFKGDSLTIDQGNNIISLGLDK